MFNLWDWIVSGFLYFLDLLLIPIFTAIATVMSGGMPISQGIGEYVRLAFRLTYPIVSVLNLYPFVMAAALAVQIKMARLAVATYMFIIDLIPGLR